MDLAFLSAVEAASAIRAKKVSSAELTALAFSRIDTHDGKLNSFVYQLREQASAAAKAADAALAQGKTLGPLHGVPIHVKESFGVAGKPCTWGIPQFSGAIAERNSVAVERLLRAGAVLLGATNVPVDLQDLQSFNPIYGVTNNPWDVKRTPGGSSGGSAAALAAGLGHLSIGSDIGGSIRHPANFCGVFGHKPTLDLVPMEGHLPGGRVNSPGFSTLLAVAGPMARSADDLIAALKVLGGPVGPESRAMHWSMAAPRHEQLRDFRVGYVLEDPYCPVASDVKAVLEQAVRAAEKAGAKLTAGWPAGMQLERTVETYWFLLMAFTISVAPPQIQEILRKETGDSPRARGLRADFVTWQQYNLRRLGARQMWESYFANVDVFLSPVSFTAAFPHDHSKPMEARRIPTAEGPRAYMDILNHISPATLSGCPATVAPVGLTASGLPVGMQVMGAYYDDATPITFAGLLTREMGGVRRPPVG